MTLKKIKILGLSIFLLVFTLQVSSQEDSQTEEETGDPVLLEKLKDIQTMEMLLEITKSDSIRTGAVNDLSLILISRCRRLITCRYL